MKKTIKLLTLLGIFTVATTSLLAKTSLLAPACGSNVKSWVCVGDHCMRAPGAFDLKCEDF